MSERTCIFPGSFDPPTLGHLNIIERALKIFDRVVVAIAENNSKSPLFSVAERHEILTHLFKNNPSVEIDHFSGLLVNYAKSISVGTILRGIRTVGDYEFELQISLANRILDPNIETVYIMTESRLSHISSSIIKEVIALGGAGKDMIHPYVEKKLKEKLAQNAGKLK